MGDTPSARITTSASYALSAVCLAMTDNPKVNRRAFLTGGLGLGSLLFGAWAPTEAMLRDFDYLPLGPDYAGPKLPFLLRNIEDPRRADVDEIINALNKI